MQPTYRDRTKLNNEHAETEIDIRSLTVHSLDIALEQFLSRLTPFVTGRKGSVGARKQDFKVALSKFRVIEDTIAGLKEALNVLETAPAAGALCPSPDDMLAFVFALKSARAAETNRFTPQLNKLFELFKTQRSEWFPELYGQDLPYIPDGDENTYGGREAIVTEEPVLA